MFKIKCRELVEEECDFEASGETKEDVKRSFFAHGAESPMHREKYNNETDEEKEELSKKIDEYLAGQEEEQ